MRMIDHALSYANRGWAVFPLVEGKKNPATANGFKNATSDGTQIQSWWSGHPDYNIGIACGGLSGIVVIDIDVDESKEEDGNVSLAAWEAENGSLPETLVAVTGRGGRHLIYKTDQPITNSTNPKLGIDIRGDGGYIVAPPSIHPNGTRYAWENNVPLAQADEKVLSFINYVKTCRDEGTGSGEQDQLRVPSTVSKGGRNDTLFRLACSLQSKGLSDSAIVSAVMAENAQKCDPPLAQSEVRQLLNSALSKEKGNATSPARVRIGLDCNKDNIPFQTITNCKKALERDDQLAGRFRYNEIAHTKMVSLPVPWDKGEGDRPIADWDYCGLASFLESKYGLMSKAKAIDAVTEISMHYRYNPITQWLDSLEWDGVERISTLLPCFLGCDMSDYNVAVMHLFMQGAVARAYEPGTKFDYMPVLIGSQGLGKSMFLRRLGHASEWYCDNFNSVEGDAAAEKLRGMWIIEMAELLATKKQKDVESIKAFLTSTVDTIRPKYARETEQRPRSCVFAGTTNNASFLTDSTGNRRFLPVECGIHKPPMSLFAKDVDEYFAQAWAEAVHIYKTQHPTLVLKGNLAQYALEKQEQYLEDDPRIGMIQQYLDDRVLVEKQKATPNLANVRVCVQEIIDEALPEEQRRTQTRFMINELHSIMQNKIRGWAKFPKSKGKARTAKYGIQRCYIPVEAIDDYELKR